MTDKMREEFEVWYEGITGSSVEFNDCGIPVSIGGALSGNITTGMWLAWASSRAALCVELPDFEQDCGECHYHAGSIKAVLDDAGVRYK